MKFKQLRGKEILCWFLGMDLSEIKDYRYHYGRTSIPVYAIDENYYCVTKVGKKPASHRDEFNRWDWKQKSTDQGFIIWEC